MIITLYLDLALHDLPYDMSALSSKVQKFMNKHCFVQMGHEENFNRLEMEFIGSYCHKTAKSFMSDFHKMLSQQDEIISTRVTFESESDDEEDE